MCEHCKTEILGCHMEDPRNHQKMHMGCFKSVATTIMRLIWKVRC